MNIDAASKYNEQELRRKPCRVNTQILIMFPSKPKATNILIIYRVNHIRISTREALILSYVKSSCYKTNFQRVVQEIDSKSHLYID